MTKIACVGITVQDRIYSLLTLPDGGGKYQANHYLEIGGGPAATAAVAIAKLGVEVDFIGRVGDDSCGNTLLAELEGWGVNTAFCRRYPNARSSQSAILVDQHGERIIVNYPSPDLGTDAEWLEAIDFSRYDLILADVRWHSGTEKSILASASCGCDNAFRRRYDTAGYFSTCRACRSRRVLNTRAETHDWPAVT